jgi:hypothetical protein
MKNNPKIKKSVRVRFPSEKFLLKIVIDTNKQGIKAMPITLAIAPQVMGTPGTKGIVWLRSAAPIPINLEFLNHRLAKAISPSGIANDQITKVELNAMVGAGIPNKLAAGVTLACHARG